MLLRWCPILPYMPSGLHCTCYSLVYGSATQCLLSWVHAGTLVFYNRNSANERVPATIMGPHNALVIEGVPGTVCAWCKYLS